MYIVVHLASPSSPQAADRFFCLPKYMLLSFLDKKKVVKSAGWRKGCRGANVKKTPGGVFSEQPVCRVAGLMFFSLPAQYNSLSFARVKQYCLFKALAASFKTVAIPKII